MLSISLDEPIIALRFRHINAKKLIHKQTDNSINNIQTKTNKFVSLRDVLTLLFKICYCGYRIHQQWKTLHILGI